MVREAEMEHKDIEEIKKKLTELENRIVRLENTISHAVSEPLHIKEKIKSGFSKLAEKVKIVEDKICEIFDIDGESLTLTKICGKDDPEKTKNGAVMTLLGYKYILNKDGLLSKEIRRNIGVNKVPLNNFATHLNTIIPSLILRKGKPKSPNTTYRLTALGEATARDLLKTVAN